MLIVCKKALEAKIFMLYFLLVLIVLWIIQEIITEWKISTIAYNFSYFSKEEQTLKQQPWWVFTPPQNRGGVIFSLQFVCVSVCLCVRLCLLTKFQPNGCTDLDAVLAKRLFSTLAQNLLKLVTMVKDQGHCYQKCM